MNEQHGEGTIMRATRTSSAQAPAPAPVPAPAPARARSPARIAALVLLALAVLAATAPPTHAQAPDVTLALDPDPPMAGRAFSVTATFGDTTVSNATLRVCLYDRAAGHATTCLLPEAMAALGEGRFRGVTDPAASDYFEAGGTIGVNLSYRSADDRVTEFPSNGTGYVLYDIATNPDLVRDVPVPGIVPILAVGTAAWAARHGTRDGAQHRRGDGDGIRARDDIAPRGASAATLPEPAEPGGRPR